MQPRSRCRRTALCGPHPQLVNVQVSLISPAGLTAVNLRVLDEAVRVPSDCRNRAATLARPASCCQGCRRACLHLVCVDRLDPVAIDATIVAAEGREKRAAIQRLEVRYAARDLDRTGDVAAISVYAQHSSAAGDASWEGRHLARPITQCRRRHRCARASPCCTCLETTDVGALSKCDIIFKACWRCLSSYWTSDTT
jgi:hypothetical protein